MYMSTMYGVIPSHSELEIATRKPKFGFHILFFSVLIFSIFFSGALSAQAGSTVTVERGQQPLFIGWSILGGHENNQTCAPATDALPAATLANAWMTLGGTSLLGTVSLPKPTVVGSFGFRCTHASGAGDISYLNVNDCGGGNVWNPVTESCIPGVPPTINGVTISSPTVVANGSTQYTITSSASDPLGGGNITDELALINYQGTNRDIHRGYLGYSSTGAFQHFGTLIVGSPVACTGGGLAARYNGYGPQYINLISCSTSISGNTRTVSYVVTFTPFFTTPFTNNTLSGWASSGGLHSGWFPFQTFSLQTPVSIDSVTISSPMVSADRSTQYTITAAASDAISGANVNDVLAMVNYLGINRDIYRGYVGYSADSVFPWWGGLYKVPPIPCTGGGMGAIYNGYGPQYINLISCSTSISGNTRTVSYVVTFNSSFVSPTTNNTLAGFAGTNEVDVITGQRKNSGWLAFNTFGLNTPPAEPTIDGVTINSDPVSDLVVADRVTPYTITSSASDSRGGVHVTDELALINYQGTNTGLHRGYLGYSVDGTFEIFGSLIVGSPIACTGGGLAVRYNGYGSGHIDLISCSTSITGNTRTVSYVVTFLEHFVSPVTDNTLSGFAYSRSSDLNSGWKPFDTFGLLQYPNLESSVPTLDSGLLIPNRPLTFTTQVQNTGSVVTPTGFHDNFTYQWGGTTGPWLDFPGNTVVKNVHTGGETSADSAVFTPNQRGDLYIQHCVDSQSEIAEGVVGEADNCSVAGPFTVSNCPATVIANCELSQANTGESGGACVSTATGACNYTCQANGSWLRVSNSCQLPTGDIDADPISVPVGGTTEITWDTTGYTACSVSGDNGDSGPGWSGVSGQHDSSVFALGDDTVIYILECDGLPRDSVTVRLETQSIDATPRVVEVGDRTDITWNLGGQLNCSVTGGGLSLTGLNTDGIERNVRINANTTFTLTCGTNVSRTPVEVVPKGFET